MKKLLIFLGLLFLNPTLFSMEEQQNQAEQAYHKQQLSRWEKVKVGGAIFGCAFFTTAVLLNRDTQRALNAKTNSYFIQHLPTAISLQPVGLICSLYQYLTNKKLIVEKTAFNICAAYSSILAFCSGLYAYKKLVQSKKTAIKKHENLN